MIKIDTNKTSRKVKVKYLSQDNIEYDTNEEAVKRNWFLRLRGIFQNSKSSITSIDTAVIAIMSNANEVKNDLILYGRYQSKRSQNQAYKLKASEKIQTKV